MQKEYIIKKEDMYIAGLAVRTNNQECMSADNKIVPLIARYWQENIADQLLHRINPGVTLSVYTDYETDEHGNYTYFFGEEVSSPDQASSLVDTCIIRAGEFVRFTTPVGKMPDVVVSAWMNIWRMTSGELGGKRRYQADFEVYDSRAADPSASSVDIYIGVR
jgi:predicted transcriptional regulator YdeE